MRGKAVRWAAVMLSASWLGCSSPVDEPASFHDHGLDLTQAERAALAVAAADGDAEAAWRLHLYHAFQLHDDEAGEPWQRRAAELGLATAQVSLASEIRDGWAEPGEFGGDPPSAVRFLLESASRSNGDACFALSQAHADGYFGVPDPVAARACLEAGAALNSRQCWEGLAESCRQGVGGPRDEAQAYYWLSLEAACCDPGSVSGEETWTALEELAALLPLRVLESAWQRVDEFIQRLERGEVVVDFAPFLAGMIPEVEVEQSRWAARRRIELHRSAWRNR